MKIAVSIPDSIFAEAESLAGRLKTSRSGIYARALREFIDRHAPERLTEAMDDALLMIDQSTDAANLAAARRVFAATEW